MSCKRIKKKRYKRVAYKSAREYEEKRKQLGDNDPRVMKHYFVHCILFGGVVRVQMPQPLVQYGIKE